MYFYQAKTGKYEFGKLVAMYKTASMPISYDCLDNGNEKYDCDEPL